MTYEAPARDLGLKPEFSLDCIGRLLAELDQQEAELERREHDER
jgi:hypothetical protein